MNWWQQILFPKTARHSAAFSALKDDRDESESAPIEVEARQPFSDGSEEFFGEFIPRDDQRWLAKKQVLIGLGITAGVLAGVGVAIWLKKSKHRKSWWRRISGK
jgi:hypothetical protein